MRRLITVKNAKYVENWRSQLQQSLKSEILFRHEIITCITDTKCIYVADIPPEAEICAV